MSNTVMGSALLLTGVTAVFLLRAQNGQERAVVRFPGAWIIVGLLLTMWIGSGVALLATDLLGI